MKHKRVTAPPSPDDGQRILVDRLWRRGLSREAAALTLWLKAIAPSHELRKWFSHDPQKGPEFLRRRRAELDRNESAAAELEAILHNGETTLLYGAKHERHDQAVALAAYPRQRDKSLSKVL